MLLSTALKEWSVAVDALASGEMMLLLRKGGIREQKGHFSAEAEQVVLLPTFEHQKPELLKPAYRSRVSKVESGWHPRIIQLIAWAQITRIFLTHDAEAVAALSAFHIWQPELAQERLKWKATQPLYVLALRTYRFAQPIDLPWEKSYGGCRSWVSLAQKIEMNEAMATPAMSDEDYGRRLDAIAGVLSQ